MRRLPSVLLLAALALGSIAFAPAPQTTSAETASVEAASTAAAQAEAQRIVVCVVFQEWTIPVVDYTWEPEYERFCVKAPDVNPNMLPVSEGSL